MMPISFAMNGLGQCMAQVTSVVLPQAAGLQRLPESHHPVTGFMAFGGTLSHRHARLHRG